MDILIKIVQLLASLSILVLIHECGHFVAAKIFKVRVDKFYLFFNPGFSLFKFKPKNSDTEYGVGWLPLGGYVKIAGMIDESLDTDQMKQPVQNWEFRSKPAWQRLIIMVAGVFMNFVLAIAIYAMILFSYGQEYVPLKNANLGMSFSDTAKKCGFVDGDILLSADGKALEKLDEESFRKILNAKQVVVKRNGMRIAIALPENFAQQLMGSKEGFTNFRAPFVVKEIMPGTPAAKAMLQMGDSIVSINGVKLVAQTDFSDAFLQMKNTQIALGFYRNGELKNTTIVPDSTGKIGVYLKPYFEIYKTQKKTYGILESVPAGITMGYKKLTGYASDMKYVFTKEGAESLGGFGSIAQLFPTDFSMLFFWEITAYLSVILAFMNILPIPALDGGHIFFLLYEAITGKKLSENFMLNAQKIGLLLLLFLLFYANGMDIVRAFVE